MREVNRGGARFFCGVDEVIVGNGHLREGHTWRNNVGHGEVHIGSGFATPCVYNLCTIYRQNRTGCVGIACPAGDAVLAGIGHTSYVHHAQRLHIKTGAKAARNDCDLVQPVFRRQGICKAQTG